MTLAELDLLESHMQQLDEELAALLRVHQAAVQRLAAVPGFGVHSAQQFIAEVGPTATTFPTARHLASWVGACPGHDESAGITAVIASRMVIAKCVDYSTKPRTRW
jgi:transposase